MDIFGGCQNFKYFFGVLEIPDIFLGCTVDAGSEPTYTEKNLSTPPGVKTATVNTQEAVNTSRLVVD